MKIVIWLIACIAAVSTTQYFQLDAIAGFLCGIAYGCLAVVICEELS